MFKGSCLCKQYNYEVEGELFDVMHCHCSICRKLHGSTFATYGGVSQGKFKWLCDISSLNKYQSSADVARYFCGNCGSLLISIDNSEPNAVYLSLGLIDSNNLIRPEYHQFVASKASWHEIKDNLPKYDGRSID